MHVKGKGGRGGGREMYTYMFQHGFRVEQRVHDVQIHHHAAEEKHHCKQDLVDLDCHGGLGDIGVLQEVHHIEKRCRKLIDEAVVGKCVRYADENQYCAGTHIHACLAECKAVEREWTRCTPDIDVMKKRPALWMWMYTKKGGP